MARLPFDFDRVNGRIRIYNLRDWRDTPRVSVPREMEPLVDEIACMAANEVSDSAEANLFRTFHYNMMSDNGFRNKDFEKLVQFCCDFVDLRYRIRETRQLDDELRKSVSTAVTMHCSKQAEDYPELLDEGFRLSNQNVARSVQANIEQFFKVVDSIERLNEEDQRDMRGYDNRRDDRRDDRRYDDRRDDRRDDYRRDRGYGSGYRDRDDRDRGYRGRYDREERVTSGREVQNRDYGDEYRTGERQIPRRVEDMFVPVQENNGRQQQSQGLPRSYDIIRRPDMDADFSEARQQEVSAREMGYTATPSPVTPTAPCPPPPGDNNSQNDFRGNVYHGAFGDYPFLQFTKDNEMDAIQHSAVYPAGSDAPAVNMLEEAKRVLTLEDAITHPVVTREQIEGSTEEVIDINIFPSIGSMVQQVSETAVAAIIKNSGENTDGVRKIIHTFGIVDNSVIGFRSLADFQAVFRTRTTIMDLIAAMEHTVNTVNSHAPSTAAYGTDMRAVVSRFDRILTREVNVFCREVLKISNGNAIKSVVGDLKDLINQVHEKVGVRECDALLAFLSQLNGSIQESMASDLGVEKKIIAMNEIDTTTFGVAMMPMSYLVTHLPFTLAELGIVSDGTTAIGGGEVSSFLRAALDVTNITSEDLVNYQHLMMTRDMEVFRVMNYPTDSGAKLLVPMDVI